MQLFTVPEWVNEAYQVVASAFALWKGGWRERLVAASFFAIAFVGYGTWQPWRVPAWYWSVVDAIMLAMLVALALRGDRYWLIWMSSLALLLVVTHLMEPLITGVTGWALASAQMIWWYLSLALLLSAAWSHSRDRGRPSAPAHRSTRSQGRRRAQPEG
ncbi:MAG: hypothetical protein ABI655_13600 [Phenylobacterium sp.]